jgi:hypothetical protein
MLKNLSGKTAIVTGSSRYDQAHCVLIVTERSGELGQELQLTWGNEAQKLW